MDSGSKRTAILPSAAAVGLTSNEALSKDPPPKDELMGEAPSRRGSSEYDTLQGETLKSKGRTMSPCHRVIVYDWEDDNVEVKKEEDIISSESSQSFRSSPNSVIEDYTKLRVSRRIDQITIYLDSEREFKPTTEVTNEEGRGNEALGTLHLDRLGFFNSMLRSLGQLSMLYVKNPTFDESREATEEETDQED